MKISFSWLQDYLRGTVSVNEVATKLTEQGIEVEAVQEIGAGIQGVVAAKITEVKPHPQANKLSLCTVFDGTSSFEVVCGAKNFKVNDLIPFAREGATLPNDMKITRRTLRGVESFGMLCSEDELGLAEEADGLWILPEDTKIGLDIGEIVQDTVLELGITPNRPDCLSHLGVAREVSAAFGLELVVPTPVFKEIEPIGEMAKVSILDPDACPRYAARILKNFTRKQSPLWMQRRLLSVGVRAISIVVDITNYVLMELGQPLHAFDLEALSGKEIRVRNAKKGEKTKTLDDVERLLSEDDLVIADAEKTVAIAGVMGGGSSEVSENTSVVLLESAYFSPVRVRRTAKRHGLHTEASHRFERGTDPEIVPLAQDRAIELLLRHAGGEVFSGRYDVYPNPIPKRRVSLRPSRVKQILGVEAPVAPLSSLGLKKLESKKDCDVWEIPSFRPDLSREIDLVEEVTRLYGMDAIPTKLPKMTAKLSINKELLSLFMRMSALRRTAKQEGFSEAVTYGFCHKEDFLKIPWPKGDSRYQTVSLANPVASDLDIMRPSLMIGLLHALARNQRRQQESIRLFEVGRVFTENPGEKPREEIRLSAIMLGEEGGWWGRNEVDFYDLRALGELLFESLGHDALQSRALLENEAPYFIPKTAATLEKENIVFGEIGEIHPDVLDQFSIVGRVFFLDISIEKLFQIPSPIHRFQELSRFPTVVRDVALLVDRNVSWHDIAKKLEKFILDSDLKIFNNFNLFDLYEGKGIPKDKRSFAISLTFRSEQRTLTEEEVQIAQESIVASLIKDLNAQLR